MVAGGFELEMQTGGSTLALEFNLCDFLKKLSGAISYKTIMQIKFVNGK